MIVPTRARLSAHMEQIVHVPEPQVLEEIVGMVQIIHQERFSIVNVLVVMHRQIPFIKTVRKTGKVPQVQFLD